MKLRESKKRKAFGADMLKTMFIVIVGTGVMIITLYVVLNLETKIAPLEVLKAGINMLIVPAGGQPLNVA